MISSYAEADFGRLIEASPVLGFIPKASLSARAIRKNYSKATLAGPEERENREDPLAAGRQLHRVLDLNTG